MADVNEPLSDPQPGAQKPELDQRTPIELYGTSSCPYTSDLREHLVWNRVVFAEYDVEADAGARARLLALTNGRAMVPVLVEHGHVKEIGWRGHGCFI
jgi:mycoredoxin